MRRGFLGTHKFIDELLSDQEFITAAHRNRHGLLDACRDSDRRGLLNGTLGYWVLTHAMTHLD
jgi:hypothetical protein